jgi:glutamine amidotransferase
VCRFLGYVGAPVTLQALLLDPPRSLRRQSYEPCHQAVGKVNADGFGAGWYSPLRREPARYRRPIPMWADAVFASIAGVVESGCVVAAVRNASAGLPVDESSTHPFTSGPWLFTHNGVVDGFREGEGERMRRSVSVERASGIQGGTDSEVLFAMALDRVDAGLDPGKALASVVADVLARTTGRLNLLLSDGAALWATARGDSLFVRPGVVASEPYDDGPGWEPVAEGSLVSVTPSSVETVPL